MNPLINEWFEAWLNSEVGKTAQEKLGDMDLLANIFLAGWSSLEAHNACYTPKDVINTLAQGTLSIDANTLDIFIARAQRRFGKAEYYEKDGRLYFEGPNAHRIVQFVLTESSGLITWKDEDNSYLQYPVDWQTMIAEVTDEQLEHMLPQYQLGDQWFYWSNDKRHWEMMDGEAGYCLVRKDSIITSVITRTS